jgi:hypothetical protein
MANKKKQLTQSQKAFRNRLKAFAVITFIMAIIFLPTTLILVIGMMPTVAAAVADKTKSRSRTYIIMFMNIAACTPFILELWRIGHNINNALMIGMNGQTMMMIYFTAATGYFIEFAVSGIVSNLLIQKARMRLNTIKKKQEKLVARWGDKVTGKYKLDEYGFPVEQAEEMIEQPTKK